MRMRVIKLSNPQKWLKWGIGASGTLAIALLFQGVRENDTFLEAVAANQDPQKKQPAQINNSGPADPYRSNEDQSPSDTLPETDSVQPFLFTLPQDPSTSLETAPQARTHASFVAPGEAESDIDMNHRFNREEHEGEEHD